MISTTTNSELISALNRVDWDFPRSSTPTGTVHSLHWFPGNFIPQIPSFLIQLLSRSGEIVLDPFCGSGTSMIEALTLGRKAIGTDVNRASIQVASGKLAFCTIPSIQHSLENVRDELLLDLKLFRISPDPIEPASRSELLNWLDGGTMRQLNVLWRIIQESPDSRVKAALELIFTDVLFSCAAPGSRLTRNQKVRRHHWGWIADNVKPSEKRAQDAFQMFLNRLNRALQVITLQKPCLLDGQIMRCDARALTLPDASVDTVVTSPPYLGMIDYTLANRLTYLWMGWPIDKDIERELGARRYRSRPGIDKQYLDAMRQTAIELHRVVRSGGKIALVLGASRKYPLVPVAVFSLFEEFFHRIWGPHPRIASRRRVSDRGGTAPSEFLCVYERL